MHGVPVRGHPVFEDFISSGSAVMLHLLLVVTVDAAMQRHVWSEAPMQMKKPSLENEACPRVAGTSRPNSGTVSDARQRFFPELSALMPHKCPQRRGMYNEMISQIGLTAIPTNSNS